MNWQLRVQTPIVLGITKKIVRIGSPCAINTWERRRRLGFPQAEWVALMSGPEVVVLALPREIFMMRRIRSLAAMALLFGLVGWSVAADPKDDPKAKPTKNAEALNRLNTAYSLIDY